MRIFVWGIILLISTSLNAQKKFYSEPLKIPIFLAGSFAELRSNHFHSGIDIKTEGRVGLPVFPTADGYVSRIVVSPVGFGNALYIDHSNGTTSLYGHLEKFNDEISKYVKNIQYQNKSFSIDVYVPSDIFELTKDEIIAFSGNTGSSGGPHLHFEIRDTKSEEPLNPLEYQFNIKDDISPKITGLRVYPRNGKSHVFYSNNNRNFEIVFYDGKYHVKNNQVIPVYGKIGFGIQSFDYLNGSLNKCGINFLSLKIDGEELFSFELNKFSFSDTRYINSILDYESIINNQIRYYKTWKDPGNRLDIYKILNHDGSFDFDDDKEHKIEIQVKDSYNNKSILEFRILSNYRDIASPEENNLKEFYYNKSNYFEAEGIKLFCPKGSFYTNFGYDYNVVQVENDPSLFSNIHEVHHNTMPIQYPLKLSIKAERLPERLQEKSLIVNIDKKTGAKSSMGGNFTDGNVSTEIMSFGNFAVTVDTIPPTISALSIKSKNTLIEPVKVRFKIYDSLSGIKSYAGTIDDDWVLFEYDAKNSLLSYTFDKERMKFGKKHYLKLVVSDNKNNYSTYEAAFFK